MKMYNVTNFTAWEFLDHQPQSTNTYTHTHTHTHTHQQEHTHTHKDTRTIYYIPPLVCNVKGNKVMLVCGVCACVYSIHIFVEKSILHTHTEMCLVKLRSWLEVLGFHCTHTHPTVVDMTLPHSVTYSGYKRTFCNPKWLAFLTLHIILYCIHFCYCALLLIEFIVLSSSGVL